MRTRALRLRVPATAAKGRWWGATRQKGETSQPGRRWEGSLGWGAAIHRADSAGRAWERRERRWDAQ
eukprot:5392879-Prymnesium_polylepis.1